MGIAAAAQAAFADGKRPISELLLEPSADILRDVGDVPIDCVLVSTNDAARYLAAVLSELCGVTPRISGTMESMCGSGGAALITAYSYVRSGLARTVLVAGAENPGSPGSVLDWDVSRGQFRSPIYWGSILTKSYMRRYGVSREDLAAVPAKNRSHAQDSPHSLYGSPCTISDVLASPPVTEDLNMLDCSRLCSGSAAVLVADGPTCRRITDAPVWISGLSQYTSSAGFGAGGSYHQIPSAGEAAKAAYAMAGTTADMVDVAEVHDAFSVCEPMALESLGMAPPGRGAALSGDLYRTGSRRVNPRGGILGAGHPLGATGLAQAAEVFAQLRGEAGKRQVENARTGIIQGMSAAGTGSVVVVMES